MFKTEQCSVGKETKTECHKSSYTSVVNMSAIETLTPIEKELLSARCLVNPELLESVCEYHKIYYLKKYEIYQLSCFDPFQCHKKKIKKALRNVSLDFSQQINSLPILTVKSIPGYKICNTCREKVHQYINSGSNFDEADANIDKEMHNLDKEISKEKDLSEINISLTSIEQSPLKFHSMPSHSKCTYAKRKIESACSTLRSKISKVLDTEIHNEDNSKMKKKNDDIQQKANDMDILINLIKLKLDTCTTYREKIQLLTLAPNSWSKKKMMEEFHVSNYAVRQAKQLLSEKGILALPDIRIGKTLSEDTVQLVKKFYENDEYSRIMPGKKDTVSISKNVHVQKRLLLNNLRELYFVFKTEYPDIKISFSKFCTLRPKWCVLAGSSGTHSVCVCATHQNVNLLLDACNIKEKYQNFICFLVCSADNRDCMLRHCSQCPSSENLKTFLLSKFTEWESNDEITYNQWITTDRTELIRCTVTFDEYLTTLIEKLQKLIPHSFISRAQSAFLKEMKTNLESSSAIVLIDFSENYSYVIQDEVQGYHWTNNSCTVHPVVIYTHNTKESGTPIVSNLCILSDDLQHDVSFVYLVQREIICFIKEKFRCVNKIHYFSDGCAGQYKNCKNFLNLCLHKNDFSFEAEWSFFATSHGKSPCDGIGGTVKRLVTKESLQRPFGNIIDSVDKVFNFCTSRFENITFKLIKKEIVSNTRIQLKERFTVAKTISGTRGFHYFVPLSKDSIGIKRISSDKTFSLVYNFSNENCPNKVQISNITTNSYVACVYDNHWFFGLVLSKEEDVQIKFMHPYGPTKSFHWPSEEKRDICYVPIYNVISCVTPPVTTTGRQYHFLKEDIDYAELQFRLRCK